MNISRSIALLLYLAASAVTAQDSTNPPVSVYRLIEGSTLTDSASVVYPLRGTFLLVATNVDPIVAEYALRDIDFYSGSRSNAAHRIDGSGQYQAGGHLAVQQQMVLEAQINGDPRAFTNESRSLARQFPLIEISLIQTQQNVSDFYSMRLVAAPVREVWFSTARQDVLSFASSEGRLIKTFSQLAAAFGIPPPPVSSDPIDAVDIQPGGEIFFSLSMDLSSPTLQTNLYHGDLLSNRGRIVRRNQQLTALFGFMPGVPDLGLDAVVVRNNREILFSIKTNVVSDRLGLIGRGDLLCERGEIVMSNAQLLQRFNPIVAGDYGLDAVYMWPSGEIWFSTELDFQDRDLGLIRAGDLLSSQGVIVYHNSEMVAPFNSNGLTNDFGLDALFVVTDFITPAAEPPRFTSGIPQHCGVTPDCARFEWTGAGRIFQVYGASEITGPFTPVSLIQPDTFFQAWNPSGHAFYLIRQW